MHNGRRHGVEFRYSEAPGTSWSMHSAVVPRHLGRLWVIIPRRTSYPISEDMAVCGLQAFRERWFDLASAREELSEALRSGQPAQSCQALHMVLPEDLRGLVLLEERDDLLGQRENPQVPRNDRVILGGPSGELSNAPTTHGFHLPLVLLSSQDWRTLKTSQKSRVFLQIPLRWCLAAAKALWSVPELLLATGRMSRVAAFLDISEAQVARVMRRAVERGMGRREEEDVRRLCIDEKSKIGRASCRERVFVCV